MLRPCALAALLALTACKSSIDLPTDLPFPCTLDGGAEAARCPEGMVCGLEGSCRSATEGADWLCRADGDCTPGWRCGLEGRCHQVGAEAAYACEEDGDCEGTWRCSPDKRCVAAADEALPPGPVTRDARVAPLVTAVPTGTPRLFEAGDATSFAYAPCSQSVYAPLHAWVEGSTLSLALHFDGEGLYAASTSDTPAQCEAKALASAGAGGARTHSQVEQVALAPRNVVALAVQGDTALTVDDQGALCTHRFRLLEAPESACAAASAVRPTALRLPVGMGADPRGALLGFDASRLWVRLQAGGAFTGPTQVVGEDGGVQPVRDALLLVANDGMQLFVTTPDALRTALVRPDGGVVRLDGVTTTEPRFSRIPVDGCDSSRPLGLGLLRWQRTGSARPALWAEVRMPQSGGDPGDTWAVGLTLEAAGKPSACPVPAVAGSVIDPPARTLCDLDVPGGLADFTALSLPDGGARVLGHGRTVDGGSYTFVTDRRGDGFCEGFSSLRSNDAFLPEAAVVRRPVVATTSVPWASSWADDVGHLWRVDTQAASEGVVALVPDRLPSALAATDTQLFGQAPAEAWGTVPLLARSTWRQVGDGGAAASTDDFSEIPFLASLEGAFPWMLIDVRQLGEGFGLYWVAFDGKQELGIRGIARFAQGDDYRPPFHAAVADTADGGTVLLTSSFDGLLAGRIAGRTLPADAPELESIELLKQLPQMEVRLVPLNRIPITSLAALPPGPDAFVQGYVVAGARVFRFRTPNGTVWRTDEIPFPDGVPLEVWADGPRGRAGFVDGTVRSLPSRVALAPPLPAGAGEVGDYALACGHTFALARTGLYRLVPTSGTAPGAWRAVPLPEAALRLAGAGEGLARGRLVAAPSSLYLLDPTGRPFRLTDLECR